MAVRGFHPGARPSLRSRLLASQLRLTARPVAQVMRYTPAEIAAIRVVMQALAPLGVQAVTGATHEPLRAAHDGRELAGEWVYAPGFQSGAVADGWAMLYLHGSGFATCSPRTHRALVSRLSDVCGMPVFTLEYRLGPEHKFPAGHDDSLAAYRWLLDQGHAAERVVVAGDSAGGHLAVWVALEALAAGLPAPAALVLMSPFLQPTWELARARDREVPDPFLVPELSRMVNRYLDGAETDPSIDLLTRSLEGLPPVLLQAGATECLAAAAEVFAERVSDAGGSCELQIWPGQVHVFQTMARLVPEASAAIGEIGRFVSALAL
jgi:acetyl esterase/lipase